MPDTASNILITTNDNTAILATDYGTSGSGLSLAHLPLQKMAWGSDSQGYRVSEAYPLPVQILGVTSNYLGVTMSTVNTASTVSNKTNTYLVVGGPATGYGYSYNALPVTGYVQGITSGILLGITGQVNVGNTIKIQGTTGGIEVGITGGRRLNSSSDSVTITGYVGICGGFGLASATDSVSVYAYNGDTKIPMKLYASDGTTLGYSGDALNVNVIGAGISASVTINPVVGITNAYGLPLMVKGSGVTSDSPVLIKGTIGSGALEITAYSSIPVGVSGAVTVDDTDIIDSLESTSKPIVSNLASIKTNTAIISSINDKLAAGTVSAKISEVIKPTKLTSAYKDVTSSAVALGTSLAVKAGVNLKAPLSNTDTVYVGSSILSTSNISGFPLDPGEAIFIEIDNISKIYVRSNSGTQKIHYITS